MKKTWLKRALAALCVVLGLTLLGTGVLVVAGLRDEIGQADVGLVLGSKVEANGLPSNRLRARLDKALELRRAGKFQKIIVSGGTGVEGFDEAAVMRDYLVANDVASTDIIVDSGGITTFATARNALQISEKANFKSVLVISQYFHIPRCRLSLRRFGLTNVMPTSTEPRDVYSSFREFFAYLSYTIRHYKPRTE